MKQVLQDLQSGATLVEDVPAPLCRPGHLRIATRVSLISSGTERTLVDFARGSILSKAMQQPDRVSEVIQKIRTDGVSATLESVRSRLGRPMEVGYCNVGQVLEVGIGVEGFRVGDRVVSNGKHAEVVVVPWMLCARIPEGVGDDVAAFAVVAAVALQGMRLAAPTLGETFVVTGLGLIGLLAVQLLRANGCRVLGLDTNPERLSLASQFGAEAIHLSEGEDPVEKATALSRGRGVDGVLLTLHSKSSKPVSQAARMCRRRGRVVLVGVTGLDINREDFYEKEITFQVSCSYGPGRYDPQYEDNGRDYPIGFVRWTEQRNFEAVLDMMASGRLDMSPLVSQRFAVTDAPKAYDVLVSSARSLGILLTYPVPVEMDRRNETLVELRPEVGQDLQPVTVGFIGAGNYGGRLIKAFQAAGAAIDVVVSSGGVSALHQGRKLGFRRIASDASAVFGENRINAVCIATRHDSHADYVIAAIEAGKNVFVEKPLCLSIRDLERIASSAKNYPKVLMVGFNRRFAPMVIKMRALLASLADPKSFVLTVNAGQVPMDHWTRDPEIGGGRIVGEACHFIDLLRHLADSPIADFAATGHGQASGARRDEGATITLSFKDGSVGVINYLTNGNKGYAKERLETFCAGRILILDNFRELTGYGWRGFTRMGNWRQDKGQNACVAAFVEAIKCGNASPVALNEIIEVSRIAIEAAGRVE